MQPIPVLVATLLGLISLAYVLYPLYRPHTVSANSKVGPVQQKEQSEREQNARQALAEVEFDFQLGNLEESDYRSLRTRYMRRALVEMKQRHQRDQEIDDEIEEQLRILKEAAHDEVEDE